MNNKVVNFCLLILTLLGLDIVLIDRCFSMNIPSEQIIPYVFFVLIAEFMFSWSLWKFETIINPFSVYSLFIYISGFSFIRLANKQTEYTPLFLVLLITSIVFFIAGGYLSAKTKVLRIKLSKYSLQNNLSLLIAILLFFIGILVFIMEIRQLGYLPVLNIGSVAVYDDLNENSVSPLHNFIILNAVLPTIFFIFYKKKVVNFLFFLTIFCCSTFILINFFSRQMIMLLFFSMLLSINYFHKISVKKLLLIFVSIVVIFIGLGEMRSNSGQDVNSTSINELLKDYTGIEKPTNLLETYLSLYGGVNFSTANKLITISNKDSYISWGAYAFRPVITILPINKEIVYPAKYSSYTELGTYLVDPYLDFRWIGVIGFNFLYGFFSMNSFRNYMLKCSPYYIIEWALFMFCIFMCSFTNFFHMFFVLFFFMINRLLIK